MRRHSSAIGLVLCASTFGLLPAAQAAPIEWTIASGGNGHLYEAVLVGSPITWEDSVAAAAAIGTDWHLATVTSAAENAFVESLFAADATFFNCCLFPVPLGRITSGPWLGAFSSTPTSNDWQWVTGEPFVFSDWGPFEPFGNGDRISYAEFGAAQTLAWNDISSGHPLSPIAFIAERSVEVSEPTTMLLMAMALSASASYIRGRRRR